MRVLVIKLTFQKTQVIFKNMAFSTAAFFKFCEKSHELFQIIAIFIPYVLHSL